MNEPFDVDLWWENKTLKQNQNQNINPNTNAHADVITEKIEQSNAT